MNKKKYDELRKQLMDEAERLIEEGKPDEAEAKMDEVRELDARWDAIRVANANMAALSGQNRNTMATDFGETGAKVSAQAFNVGNGEKTENSITESHMNPKELYKTDEYRIAWAKTMMNKQLTKKEADIYSMANEYIHTTENSSAVIPESVASGIWSEAEELYPYFGDITKTYVSGNLTIIKSTSSSEAAWYDEDTKTDDGEEAFGTIQLTGCELSRAITVSWKLKEMAIDDFLAYITRRMAERMGAGLGYGVVNGKGKPGTGDTFKPEPLGVVTALKAEKDTPQVVKYEEGNLKYSDITKARGKVKSGYSNGLNVYANADTIWNTLANVTDGNGRPIFIGDATAGGVYRVLGVPVKEDASMSDGDILFSNAPRGYQANVNKQIGVAKEEHIKDRQTDYCAYAIVDGAPITQYAHALLTKTTAGA